MSLLSVSVAGVEARGFIFGPPIALAIGAKFVPLRKPGKLPGNSYLLVHMHSLHEVVSLLSYKYKFMLITGFRSGEIPGDQGSL